MRHLTICLLLCSCAYFRSTEVPMPSDLLPAPTSPATGLVILLPGIGDPPSLFVDHGFVERIHAIDERFDVIVADAHLGYYRTDSIAERLHADLIADATSRYRHIWLVGVSMGGLGAAVYASQHPDDIDGVILLAPFLDYQNIIEDIQQAGGLSQWQPRDLGEVGDPMQRLVHRAWSWLRAPAVRPDGGPQVFVGCGSGDPGRDSKLMLIDVLPPDHLLTLPGGHDWTVWARLFDVLAERALTNPSEVATR